MKIKQFLNDLKDFVVYFLTEPFFTLLEELKEIWNVLTNKKAWIFAWFVFFIISLILNLKALMLFSLVMFFVFFVIFHWKDQQWKAKARERWYKKHGLEKFKKKNKVK